MAMQQPPHRYFSSSWLAAALVASGSALWVSAALRKPGALSMLPGFDGCLTAGIVGALLALLHGIPFRATVLLLLPIAAVQVGISARLGVSFLPMLGIEMAAVGLMGVVQSWWSAGPGRPSDPARPPEAAGYSSMPARRASSVSISSYKAPSTS
jgi:hypothetical protein